MRKYKKIDIAIFTVLVFIVATTAIIGINIYIVATGSFSEDTEESSKIANQDLGNILTRTVELTIPKDMLSLSGDDFDYSLTQEQKDSGFTDIKKNADGSATYTIKMKDYEKFISEYKNDVKKSIDELNADGTFASIQKIEYTDNFEKITIIVDKEKFENSFDSVCMLNCGLASCMYQMFDVNSAGKCTVEVKDSASGKVFQTEVYPDAMQED